MQPLSLWSFFPDENPDGPASRNSAGKVRSHLIDQVFRDSLLSGQTVATGVGEHSIYSGVEFHNRFTDSVVTGKKLIQKTRKWFSESLLAG